MLSNFYTNYSDEKFIDKLKASIDTCQAFYFSVSFIKKPGLRILAPNIEAAIARGARGQVITSTYQNFTDVDSLNFFMILLSDILIAFLAVLTGSTFMTPKGLWLDSIPKDIYLST